MRIITKIRKEIFKLSRKMRLNNKNITIISSNCVGGIIYHDLNLKFNSPTINLFFSSTDFVKFCLNLEAYLNAELKEINKGGIDCPIGQLKHNNETININFMHYSSFEEAKNKWNERKKRINFDNIYIILDDPKYLEKTQLIELFNQIPYKNKVVLTKANNNDSNIIDMPCYHKEYQSGDLIKYKSKYSKKRYLDDWDYIKFLNSK